MAGAPVVCPALCVPVLVCSPLFPLPGALVPCPWALGLVSDVPFSVVGGAHVDWNCAVVSATPQVRSYSTFVAPRTLQVRGSLVEFPFMTG